MYFHKRIKKSDRYWEYRKGGGFGAWDYGSDRAFSYQQGQADQ